MELAKLTPAEFRKFATFVYDRTGIHLEERKLALLSNRLRKRLNALNLPSFEDYYRHVSRGKDAEQEMSHFLSAVTTNETYFFRNSKLWDFIRKTLIKGYVNRKGAQARTLRIWSAASSSGEEAYTTAIALREEIPNVDQWNITMIGSDISKTVLDRAKAAVYNDYAVSKISKAQLNRWFNARDGEYQLKDEVRRMVRFQSHNLRDPFPSIRFDLVFLRNVLMYFDTSMKLRVLKVVTDALAPDGHLIIGDVDPVRSTPELRDQIALEPLGPGVYHKPAGASAAGKKDQLVKT